MRVIQNGAGNGALDGIRQGEEHGEVWSDKSEQVWRGEESTCEDFGEWYQSDVVTCETGEEYPFPESVATSPDLHPLGWGYLVICHSFLMSHGF